MFKEVEMEKALELLLTAIKYYKTESVNLDKCLYKVLAENIYATINVPDFNKSAMDGYALRAKDIKGAKPEKPIILKVVEEIQAGDTRELDNIAPGCAVRIFTGAPLPNQFDVVVRQEDFTLNNGSITFEQEFEKDLNIVFKGSDIRKGELIFKRGERIGAYHIGVLAALGINNVCVCCPPKIALISTGNELKEPGEELGFGQIYNSNLHCLAALIDSLGAFPLNLGIVNDEVSLIKEKLFQGLRDYDLVITTGGASVGNYDLIEESIKALNGEILFNRVKIKPGSPVVCGVVKDKFIIGLSGNPAAALISFELLLRPLIKKMMGMDYIHNRYLEVELADGFTKKSPQRRFLRVNIYFEDGKWAARQTGKQQSAVLKSMVGCNGLVDLPRGSGPVEPGSQVKALLLKEDLVCCPQSYL
ncbi:MAG: gephyrin-like molybdotransferase Glp [Bacillota bacterium]